MYRIGSGACIFDTEEKAQSVWAAIRVSMVDSYNDYPEASDGQGQTRLLKAKTSAEKRLPECQVLKGIVKTQKEILKQIAVH
jgi:hypothetical protein